MHPSVIWNGPMGVFEFDAFAKGTNGIATTLAELTGKGCVTIIGGGGEDIVSFHHILFTYIWESRLMRWEIKEITTFLYIHPPSSIKPTERICPNLNQLYSHLKKRVKFLNHLLYLFLFSFPSFIRFCCSSWEGGAGWLHVTHLNRSEISADK